MVIIMAFNQIINNYPQTTFSRNQIIFSEGEKCSKIGIIIEGEIKISTITHHEKEETFTIVKKGDIFGNSLIFSSSPYYLGDITATQKTTICFISKSDLIKELSLHPDLLESYINIISDKAIRIKQQNKLLAHKNIRDRISYYFITLSKQQNSNIIQLPSITKLSNELSLPRPSVSRELTNMENDGLILRKQKLCKLKFIENK